MFAKYSMLSVQNLIRLENCKLMFKSKRNLLPVKIQNSISTDQHGKSLEKCHGYNTRQKKNLNTPINASTIYLKSALCQCNRAFSSLSLETQGIENLKMFVRACKKELTSS